jgi:antitoxin HigA-1
VSIPRDAAVDYADVIDPDAEPVGPIHPGVILEEEFLESFGFSAYALAKAIGVPRNRITGIVRGERAITADTALRLARFFAVLPEFWLGFQMDYDLETTRASTLSMRFRMTSPGPARTVWAGFRPRAGSLRIRAERRSTSPFSRMAVAPGLNAALFVAIRNGGGSWHCCTPVQGSGDRHGSLGHLRDHPIDRP